MQKVCLKSLQEDAAARRHKQMTFSDAGFLGALRVKISGDKKDRQDNKNRTVFPRIIQTDEPG